MEDFRILLVGNNDLLKIIIFTTLESEGFKNIVLSLDNENAIDLLKQQHFDLIIIEIDEFLTIDSLETIEIIRKMLDCMITPIISLSIEDNRAKCVKAGSTSFISKPVGQSELIEMVNFYLPISNE